MWVSHCHNVMIMKLQIYSLKMFSFEVHLNSSNKSKWIYDRIKTVKYKKYALIYNAKYLLFLFQSKHQMVLKYTAQK